MCIIVSKEINNKFILAKNRDRAYKPVLEVVHTLLDGVEVAYLHDITTDWSEGLNEFGIGAVNSALLVRRDESEKKILKKTGKKGCDGEKMRNIIKQKTLEDAIESCLVFKGKSRLALKGHTFISSPHHMVSVETTSKHKPDIQTHNIKYPVVRTNHGHTFADAGYTRGVKYLSSKIRKISAENSLESINDWNEVGFVMRNQYYEPESQLNMRRTTQSMFTSSQTVMNLTDLILKVEWFTSKVQEFKGINNELPKDYKSKIRIIIDKIDV
jgi:hypothetical protein